MKRSLYVLLALLFAATVLFVSCNPEKGIQNEYGSLKAKVSMQTSRAIEPSREDLKCTRYVLKGTYSDGKTAFSVETLTGEAYEDKLLAGSWSVYAEGYNADDVLIAKTAAETVEIKTAQTTIKDFDLSYLTIGDGTLSVTVKIAEAACKVARIDMIVGSTYSASRPAVVVDGYYEFLCTAEISAGEHEVSILMFDEAGNLIGTPKTRLVQIYVGLTSEETWKDTGSATTEYDADGKEKNKIYYSSDGTIESWNEYAYDDDGNRTKITNYNSDGTVHSVSEYGRNGKCTKTTSYLPDGSIESWIDYSYDTDGNRKMSIEYNADGIVHCIYEYASGNRIKKYVLFDSKGHVLISYECEPSRWLLIGNWDNNNGESGISIIENDANWNVTKIIDYYDDGTIRSCDGFEYDANGNEIKYISYNLNGTISYVSEFDSNGNQIRYTHCDSNGSVLFVYECAPNGKLIVGNWNGDDGESGISISEYDSNGNRTKRISYNSDWSIESWSEYEYDANGNRIKYTSFNSDGTINNSDGTIYYVDECDENGNWTTKYHNRYYSDGRKEITEYDADGNRTKTTSYNSEGNISSVTEYDGNGNLIGTYDGDGNPIID